MTGVGLSVASPETMLRDLHKRFERVRLWRDLHSLYRIECRRSLRGDSREYAPQAWGATASEVIRTMWERA